ncbi:MAG: hypothetical protein IJG09_08215 [Methanobrevibacter sp.]|nr:hypothetical protein [Methanobrevibacter sp.]MBQ6345116.1 hypothetical protein [Methanobrevibacter sp.]
MITVYGFRNLFIDDMQELAIFDNESGQVVWTGYAYQMPDEYDDLEIDSIDTIFDPTKVITINVTVPVD